MRLKVMTFNEADDNPIWSDKKGQVLEIINDYAPDLLGLQEVANETLHGIKEAEIYETALAEKGYGFFFIPTQGGAKGHFYGTPIAYKKDRFQLLESGVKWLSDTPDVAYSKDPVSAYARGFLYVILKDLETGKSFTYVNAHLDYVDEANYLQVQRLLELTAAQHRAMPTVYTADWNMNPTQRGYAYFGEQGFVSTMDEAHDPQTGTMVPDESGYSVPIDFCFVPKRYLKELHAYKVVNDHRYSMTASDHFAVFSDMTLSFDEVEKN